MGEMEWCANHQTEDYCHERLARIRDLEAEVSELWALGHQQIGHSGHPLECIPCAKAIAVLGFEPPLARAKGAK